MNELSLTAIKIIAESKLLLFALIILILLIIKFKPQKPWLIGLLLSAAISGFYLILAWPLKKMWWGNVGDEIFISSFLNQVLANNPLNDFFYHYLPNFYPPLYFWLTGLISRLFAQNAITAAKFGVAATLFLLFSGLYWWLKIFYQKIKNHTDKISTTANPWFWLIVPIIFFWLTNFNDILLKPYEALPALAVSLLVGMIVQAFNQEVWTKKYYLFLGISGGILFLTYYFWWFLAIPALLAAALTSKQKIKNLLRLLYL